MSSPTLPTSQSTSASTLPASPPAISQTPRAASPAAPLAASTPASPAQASSSSPNVQVFRPADASSKPAEPDASFFEPTISDVQSYHTMIVGRSKQLNEAPLLTAKHREAERAAAEKRKADKWPNATIRIKFSDGTQIQSIFPSTSPIQPVYAFVRESLSSDATAKPFTLYQPPRTTFPEHPVPQPPAPKHINPAMRARVVQPQIGPQRGPNAAGIRGGSGGKESLSELGLVPQSVLLVRWEDAMMNSSDYPAPLKDELRAQAAPLPPPAVKEPPEQPKKLTGKAGEVKMPKWLQKGLMKKK
ncbi:hypothetical protein CC85DRAFT_289353 [Cutaneotrichosporon oleaginosum]|uniref:UBX domain-containing protein n=1 Tax=Cutaneotrichosporon oleaginosum TaxID=879819 RepID=A0A0J1ATG3_9TREE|nr:uncharacterized protein CC85DRAFT_289353 [Cutaneotrichosporon oleaginosum]KLT38604.1 hypothetical protein CC85DRAFT_289353 [Cutaneotrichosporon oleaginosum]TXT05804.1 hypothetical protein COLE_07124 [Cutaneotrichosporon oleaginosum]